VPSVRRAVLGVACVGIAAVSVTPAQGAFPGRNGRIAYVDSGNGISSVWPDGTGRRQLVRRGGPPTYSPRGDRIVFPREFKLAIDHPLISFFELSRLELVTANGGRRRVLTDGDDFAPGWAPKGRRIVFSRVEPCARYSNAEADCPPSVQQDKKYGILIRWRDGRTRVVTRNGWDPEWSPNGKLIMYRHEVPGDRTGLYAIKPDGSRARLLVRTREVEAHEWSPDGSRIVFTYGPNRADIAEVRSDGTRRRRLIRNGMAPAYSPDGRWIVFARSDERHCGYAESALWVISSSGGHPRVLRYRSGRRICGYGPDWQPLR
jgi:Tol biopolymer transport system component